MKDGLCPQNFLQEDIIVQDPAVRPSAFGANFRSAMPEKVVQARWPWWQGSFKMLNRGFLWFPMVSPCRSPLKTAIQDLLSRSPRSVLEQLLAKSSLGARGFPGNQKSSLWYVAKVVNSYTVSFVSYKQCIVYTYQIFNKMFQFWSMYEYVWT